MNASSDNLRASLVDQLSSFEDKLGDKADDVQMLAEIQSGIGRLLGSAGASEAQIRRVLQERYDAGQLRKETFQLVKSMLDRYVTEIIETSPSIADASAVLEGQSRVQGPPPRPKTVMQEPPPSDDAMSSTVVLPADETVTTGDAEARVQVGSLLRDRFLLQERVSGGSMGVVYKAMDRRLAESGTDAPWVAIKVLAPALSQNGKALQALQQEANKGRSLVHPNIVRFIDLDRDDDLYFIVMEWLEGRTLADILDSADARGIDIERSFQIVRQIGKALEYAHKCGIVHADVKPGNIMIMPNGDAKLFDFGVARVRQNQVKDRNFDPGVLGRMTPAYSSMQVLTGETPVPADDVFSLACLLYRLVAGFRVFGPRNAAEAADEGMKPQQPDGLNDTQWRVLKKALSYSRITRFQSMNDFMEALDADQAESITVDIPAPKRFTETEESGGVSRLLIGFFVVAALGVVTANQLGYLDELKATYLPSDPVPEIIDGTALEEPEIVSEDSAAPESEPVATEPVTADTDQGIESAEEVQAVSESTAGDSVVDQNVSAETLPQSEAQVDSPVDEPVSETEQEAPTATADAEPDFDPLQDLDNLDLSEPEAIAAPTVDFSTLPPPTAIVSVGFDGQYPNSTTLVLREDSRGATLDLVRSNTELAATMRIEEIAYTGNRSPWTSGQYTFSNNGFVEFPAGQNRARIELSMASDPLREADQQSTLRVRDADSPGSNLATITVNLEDDDQRRFEQTLPANTIAFATSQVTVAEDEPAVQLDIMRFNPDDTSMVVGYTLRDITAKQGEDYFAPGGYTIEFGPGQRSTRLLIPLVQDFDYEDNEAFSVELSTADSQATSGVFQRVAVLIRDDDQ